MIRTIKARTKERKESTLKRAKEKVQKPQPLQRKKEEARVRIQLLLLAQSHHLSCLNNTGTEQPAQLHRHLLLLDGDGKNVKIGAKVRPGKKTGQVASGSSARGRRKDRTRSSGISQPAASYLGICFWEKLTCSDPIFLTTTTTMFQSNLLHLPQTQCQNHRLAERLIRREAKYPR